MLPLTQQHLSLLVGPYENKNNTEKLRDILQHCVHTGCPQRLLLAAPACTRGGTSCGWGAKDHCHLQVGHATRLRARRTTWLQPRTLAASVLIPGCSVVAFLSYPIL
jgi:hypothetical protein